MSTRGVEGTAATGQEVPALPPWLRGLSSGKLSLGGKTGADCTPFDATHSHCLSKCHLQFTAAHSNHPSLYNLPIKTLCQIPLDPSSEPLRERFAQGQGF